MVEHIPPWRSWASATECGCGAAVAQRTRCPGTRQAPSPRKGARASSRWRGWMQDECETPARRRCGSRANGIGNVGLTSSSRFDIRESNLRIIKAASRIAKHSGASRLRCVVQLHRAHIVTRLRVMEATRSALLCSVRNASVPASRRSDEGPACRCSPDLADPEQRTLYMGLQPVATHYR